MIPEQKIPELVDDIHERLGIHSSTGDSKEVMRNIISTHRNEDFKEIAQRLIKYIWYSEKQWDMVVQANPFKVENEIRYAMEDLFQ